jgi:hypothetical protein
LIDELTPGPKRKAPRDPHKRRLFVIVAVLGMAGLAAVVWALVIGQDQNKQAIEDRPTTEQLLGLLRDRAQKDRERCRVVNRKFDALADQIATQRPTTQPGQPGASYYAAHPDELKSAQDDFDKTLAVLRPSSCLKQYPPPTLKDAERLKDEIQRKGGRSTAKSDSAAEP